MAWGLIRSMGEGIYFPSGDYVGWEDKIEEYFVSITPEEEIAKLKTLGEHAYTYDAITKIKHAAGEKFRNGTAAAQPHERPSEFRTKKSFDTLASLLTLTNGLTAVDEPLRALIEEFERGVHQFWRLKITMPRGKEFPMVYYGMIVLQERDSVVPHLSELVHTSPEGGYFYRVVATKAGFRKLVVSRVDIGSAHLWRERRLVTPDLLISDALHAAIAARGLKIWRHYQVREV